MGRGRSSEVLLLLLALVSTQRAGIATSAEEAGQPPEVTLFFEGTAQGGEITIGIAEDALWTVKTMPGDRSAQVVQRFCALPEGKKPFNACGAAGIGLRLPFVGQFPFVRSTDPGMPGKPGVTHLRVVADATGKGLTVSWDGPAVAPAFYCVKRNNRGLVSTTGKTAEDSGASLASDVEFLSYQVICCYKTEIDGKRYFQTSDAVTSGPVKSPWYDPNDKPPSPNVPPGLPNGKVNAKYSYQMKDYRLGPAVLVWSVHAGTLPPGLMLTENGLLSGTPTTAGVYRFEVRETGTKGRAVEVNCKLTIE